MTASAPCGAQDARGLGERHRPVEPVPGLRARDPVERRVGERQGLRRAVEHLESRQRGGELRAHARDGLDGDDVGPGRHEQARQLAGAGREVEDATPGCDAERGDDVRDRVRGVRRARPLVDLGGAIEALRRHRIDALVHRSPPQACSSTITTAVPGASVS